MSLLAEPRPSGPATQDSPEPRRSARMPLYSVVVAGSATTFATLLAATGRVWMLPLAAALVYLTVKSYRIHRNQAAADQRHHEEMTRMHGEAIAALEAARQSEQRYARAARH